MTPKGKKKSSSQRKKKELNTASVPVQEVASDDIPIVADEQEEVVVETTPIITPVESFTGGFVNPCLANSVSAFWRKTPETELLNIVIHDALYLTQTFVGDIAVRSSFMQTKGGAALL